MKRNLSEIQVDRIVVPTQKTSSKVNRRNGLIKMVEMVVDLSVCFSCVT
jgi:hypothetical protein